MQMKQIKFLLAFFVLALGGQLKAVTLPETSEGDKVKWYFLQTTRADYAEPTFYTVMDDGLIKGRAQAVYPDVDGMNKQLWKFETEDGEWYTITNCYDGRKLGTGVGPNGESLMMQDAPQAKFKLRDLTATVGYDCFGLETDTPAPGGGTQYRWPSMTGPNDPYDGLVWLVGEGSSTGDDCGIIAVEFDGVYEPATGSELLQTYLNRLPANWESTYLYGTDPGFEKDEAKVIEYTDLVYNALTNIATMSDDECQEAYDKIQELTSYLDDEANIVPINENSYYYITTANADFTGNGKTNYGWYGPMNEKGHIGWKALEPNSSFVWTFTRNDDGTYKIKHLLTDMYVDSTLVNQLSDQAFMADLPVREQIVTRLNGGGQFNIEFKGAVAPYHQNDHQGGAGESGTVVQWDGEAGSPSAWYLREVPEAELQQILSNLNFEKTEFFLAQNPDFMDDYVVGTGVGQLNDQTVYDNIKAAYETVLNEVGNNHTNEEYGTYLDNLNAAIAAADESVTNPLTEGYYKFTVANPDVLTPDDESLRTLAWAQHKENTSVVEWSKDDGTADYIWKVTFADNEGHIYIQNAATKQYVSCGTNLWRGQNISSSAEPLTKHYIDMIGRSGVVNIYNTDYPAFPYHALNWDTSLNGTVCYAEGNPARWYMKPVDAEEAEKLIAEALNRDRIDTLRNIISQAEAKIADTDIPVYDFSKPVVTNADQFYSNAQAPVEMENTSFDHLIDGDYGTIFHSVYNSTVPIDDYHYLRVYAPDGLPDKFGIHWAKRCFSQWADGNTDDRPTKIVIGLSNDGETWERLDTLTTADGLPTIETDTFYTSKQPIEGAGYTYFLMKVLEINHRDNLNDGFGHPFFTMSEYNLYPYTGTDPASQINFPEIKPAVENLQAAIADAEQVIASGVVGDDAIPALQAAYNKLLEAWVDTTKFAYVYNTYKQTAALAETGDEPGYVDSYEPVDEFDLALDEIHGSVQAPNISNAILDEAISRMDDAYDKFMEHVVMPEPYVWYVIKSGVTDEAFSYAINQPVFLGSTNAGTQLSIGGYPTGNEYTDVYAIWRLVPVENDDATAAETKPWKKQYAIQSLGTGQYWGPYRGQGSGLSPLMSSEPAPYNLYSYGMGCFALQQEGVADPADRIKADGTNNVVLNYPADGGHQQSWRFERVDYVTSEVKIGWYPANNTAIITLPWAMKGENSIHEYNSGIETYAVSGVETVEDPEGGEPSYNLLLTAKDEFEAGEPFILVTTGEPDENGNQPLKFALPAAEADAITDTCSTDYNGLNGTLQGMNISNEASLYFNNSVLNVCSDSPVFIAGRSGYIDATKVQNLGGTPDKVIGIDGIINNIGKVEITDSADAPVNVYTIDGILLKRNVKASEATRNLPKGVYIVGKEKVLVK